MDSKIVRHRLIERLPYHSSTWTYTW